MRITKKGIHGPERDLDARLSSEASSATVGLVLGAALGIFGLSMLVLLIWAVTGLDPWELLQQVLRMLATNPQPPGVR